MKKHNPVTRVLNEIFDLIFIALMLFLLVFAAYSKFDTDSLYGKADPKQWIEYKPDFPDDVLSFEELQELNSEVLGWITIYDTNIDYPIVQHIKNNSKYLNHDAKGEPSSAGAIYLDYRNNPDFSDFNTIIYGHHMAENKMFGDIDKFLDKDFFDKHEFGNLYANGINNGIQFLAMLEADGYNWDIYAPGIQDETERLEYLNHLYDSALYVRGVDLSKDRKALKQGLTSPITPNDHIVLLSTCSADITNGRFVLVGKILDHPVENPYPKTEMQKKDNGTIDAYSIMNTFGKLPVWEWILILVLLIILVLILYLLSRRKGEKAHGKEK